jgi:2-polyprenyl-3-methyl-5-hydroxy-6-metoxy-1,4-benzoquinol methylase
MSDQEKFAALQTYFNLMNMNGAARIYRTAREQGIFDAIGNEPATAADVAGKCGLQEEPVRLLLDGLCAIGTLVRTDEYYSPALVTQFLAGNYQNLSDEYWDYLPQFLKTGVPLAEMDSVEQSEDQYEKQVSALAWMMTPAAEAMAHILGMGLSRKALQILDVGAGSAIWSLTCAKHDPETSVTAADWPVIVDIAAGFAKQMGLADRFAAIPGNYHESNLGEDAYDLAIVANVTHIETPDGNRDLFRKLHKALKAGGEVIIVDVMPVQPDGQISAALYALGLGLRTAQGQVHSVDALQQYLGEAGFADARLQPIPVAPHTMGMIIAKKES